MRNHCSNLVSRVTLETQSSLADQEGELRWQREREKHREGESSYRLNYIWIARNCISSRMAESSRRFARIYRARNRGCNSFHYQLPLVTEWSEWSLWSLLCYATQRIINWTICCSFGLWPTLTGRRYIYLLVLYSFLRSQILKLQRKATEERELQTSNRYDSVQIPIQIQIPIGMRRVSKWVQWCKLWDISYYVRNAKWEQLRGRETCSHLI